MSSVDDYEDKDSVACPYCQSENGCVHLLLVVDRTFQTVEGGVLYEAFHDRLAGLPDDEAEEGSGAPFERLVLEVEELAEASDDYVMDSPGMSSAYQTFYASSDAKAQAVVAVFTLAATRPS